MDCSMPGFPVLHYCLLPSIFPSVSIFSNESALCISGQSIGASALASVLSMNFQGWFPLGLTGLISCCPRDSQESSPAPQLESISSLGFSFFYCPDLTSIHDYWKKHSLDYIDLCWQTKVFFFNMLPTFVIAFLPRSKRLLISWLQSLSTVILEPKKIKSVTVFTFSSSVCPEVMGPDAMILGFWMLFLASFLTFLFHPRQDAL